MPRRDYRPLLEDLGVNGGRVVGAQWYAHCPIHQGSSQNFSVNVENGLWVCFRGCGQGSLTQLIVECTGKTYMQALSYLQQWEKGIAVRDITAEELLDELGDAPPAVLAHSPLASGDVTRERWPLWWPERGFDVEDWAAFDCATDEDNGDVVIPIHDWHMEFLGEVRRRMPGVEPRYLYSRGMNKSQVLFGEHNATREGHFLVVVEGPLDLIWMRHCLIPSVGLLGSQVSEEQGRRLSTLNPKLVIMALDNDKAGREGTMKALPLLARRFTNVRVVVWPEGVKDAQDVKDEDALRLLMANAVDALEWSLRSDNNA